MVSRIAFLAWGPGVYTPKASDAIWSSWDSLYPSFPNGKDLVRGGEYKRR